jgi:hypothetical protein
MARWRCHRSSGGVAVDLSAFSGRCCLGRTPGTRRPLQRSRASGLSRGPANQASGAGSVGLRVSMTSSQYSAPSERCGRRGQRGSGRSAPAEGARPNRASPLALGQRAPGARRSSAVAGVRSRSGTDDPAFSFPPRPSSVRATVSTDRSTNTRGSVLVMTTTSDNPSGCTGLSVRAAALTWSRTGVHNSSPSVVKSAQAGGASSGGWARAP